MINIPGGPFRVVYADPPWDRGGPGERSLDTRRHYQTMPLADICAIKIPTERTAVLFLWACVPLLPEALEVVKAWGFNYKSQFVWDKMRPVYGGQVGVSHEILLIATRGRCSPDCKILMDSVQVIERGRHSQKPAFFRMAIDKLYPSGKRIELFARGMLPEGWEGFGNEYVGKVAA